MKIIKIVKIKSLFLGLWMGCLACGTDGPGRTGLAFMKSQSAQPLCDEGFEAVDNTCVDINECVTGNHLCGTSTDCVNRSGSYLCAIHCDATSFGDALATCGGGAGITLACSNQTILIPEGNWAGNHRAQCDGLVIDGLDRNIVFQLDPPCFGDDPDSCSDVENGTMFLRLQGDNNVVRNLSVRYFFEGIHVSGENNTVENVVLSDHCDDALTNRRAGVGTLYKDLQISGGCDKCIQDYGNPYLTSDNVQDRNYYNVTYDNVTLENCRQPIRLTESGRFRIAHSTMQAGDGVCDGPRFSGGYGAPLVVHMENSLVQHCRRGIRIGGAVEAVLKSNTIQYNALRGVRVSKDARVRLAENLIRHNGGSVSAEVGFGGVTLLDESAVLDLGDDDAVFVETPFLVKKGNNKFCDNKDASGTLLAVDNRSNTVLMAKFNHWCADEPEEKIHGDVDFTPVLQTEPNAGSTKTLEVAKQNKDQQRCVTSLNKARAKAISAGAKDVVKCVNKAAKQDVNDCVKETNPKKKLPKALNKISDAYTDKCSAKQPDLGFITQPTDNPEPAALVSLGIAHTLFGDTFEKIQESDKSIYNCQKAVAKSTDKLLQAYLAPFNKCIAKGLKAEKIVSTPTYEDCFTILEFTNAKNKLFKYGIGHDPKEKIRKARTTLTTFITKKCKYENLSTAFAEPCSDMNTLEDFSTCVDAKIENRIYGFIRESNALESDTTLHFDP